MWDLQQKLAQQQKSTEYNESQESTNINYFMESLKFGADLQRNFLLPKRTKREKKIVENTEEDTKSFYMYDYNTKKSKYF